MSQLKNQLVSKWMKAMSITKPCTQLHAAPSTSTQLHPPPPSSFQSPPSSLQHPQQYLNQNIARNWVIFANLRPKNQKLSILNENWRRWYIGSVDSESRVRYLKFRPQSPFLSKFGPKKSKLSVLSEDWCTWYLKDADSESRLRYLKFQPQNPFLGQIWAQKFKGVRFVRKLVHMVSQGCWFLFQH